MKHIILSPHLDDAVFSLGGYIKQLSDNNENLEIWTIFAGENPQFENLTPIAQDIHLRWGYRNNTIQKRIEEDKNALNHLGVNGKYFEFKDAIYRKNDFGENVINKEKDFVKEFDENNYQKSIYELENKLTNELTIINDGIFLYLPIAMGNHPDHKILRIAIERIIKKNPKIITSLFYFADFPYTYRVNDNGDSYMDNSYQKIEIHISQEHIQSWIKAISEYTSQFQDYWKDQNELESQLKLLLNNKNKLSIWKVI